MDPEFASDLQIRSMCVYVIAYDDSVVTSVHRCLAPSGHVCPTVPSDLVGSLAVFQEPVTTHDEPQGTTFGSLESGTWNIKLYSNINLTTMLLADIANLLNVGILAT